MKKYIFLFIVTLGVIFGIKLFYEDKNIIKIGFSGTLSGENSTLGHSVLNGLLLAFDEHNYEVDGKKIKIFVEDDMQNKQKAKNIINKFKKQNIDLVIGNITSAMTKASLSQIPQNSNLSLISATSSSGDFSNQDDKFFRVQVAQSKERFSLLSKYLIKNNIKNILAIYDANNSSYSNNFLNNFEKSFISFGGAAFVKKISLDNSYEKILEKIEKNNLDSIVIVANSIEASNLIQFLKLKGVDKLFCVSAWAKNQEFIENGGKAVNNTIFLSSYDENSTNKKYIDFTKKYKAKYKVVPTVFSAQAYEAGNIILKVLQKDSDLKKFKKTLLSIKKFEGLQGSIFFDEYGDVQREQYLSIIRDNKIVRLDIK